MKSAATAAGILIASLASAALAGPQEDAVKAVVKAIKRGDDLNAAFPGAISAREIESLRRVSKCSAINLMKQEKGRYTIVWNCGSKGILGMEVKVTGTQVTAVSTMAVTTRPHLE